MIYAERFVSLAPNNFFDAKFRTPATFITPQSRAAATLARHACSWARITYPRPFLCRPLLLLWWHTYLHKWRPSFHCQAFLCYQRQTPPTSLAPGNEQCGGDFFFLLLFFPVLFLMCYLPVPTHYPASVSVWFKHSFITHDSDNFTGKYTLDNAKQFNLFKALLGYCAALQSFRSFFLSVVRSGAVLQC